MKKRLMMVMCCGIMILGNLSGCNAMKTKETEYHWPTSTLVKSLPVPESKYGEIVLDAEDSFEIDVFNTSKSQFADYINACKENGFNVDYYGTEDSYDAENKDGYRQALQDRIHQKKFLVYLLLSRQLPAPVRIPGKNRK